MAWNEVGIISLAANADNAGVNDYLGAGPVLGATTGTTGNIGRFYPAQFALSGGTIYNRTDISACATAGCGSFTYMGEQMNAVFTLTAQNLSGSPTLNYNYSSTSAKNFAKLDPTVFANLNMGAVDRVTTPTQPYLLSSRISVSGMPPVTCSTNPCFLAGVAKNIIAPFMITRGGSPDGVYTTVDIGINPTDEIGGATVPFNIDTTTATNPAVTMNSGKVGTTALRYGRMKISNASGSQLLSLPFSLTAQYWNVNDYVTSADDTNTNSLLTSNNILLGAYNYHANDNWTTTVATFTNGSTTGTWAATLHNPIGNFTGRGSVPITTNAPPYLPSTTGLATFGTYTGNKNLIYMRENY